MGPRFLMMIAMTIVASACNGSLKPRASVPPGMVWIPGGTFTMGSNDHYPEEAPAHQVSVSGFWIDQCGYRY